MQFVSDSFQRTNVDEIQVKFILRYRLYCNASVCYQLTYNNFLHPRFEAEI